MGLISVTLPSDGTTIDAADYNTPITTIVNAINGNISTDNIAASSITNTQVAAAGLNTTKIYNPYKFFYVIGSAASILATTAATLTCTSLQYDTSSNYSTSTGRFTVPVSGFYQINAQVDFSSTIGAWVGLWKNGAEVYRGNRQNVSSNITMACPISVLLQLNAGDYIQLGYYSFTATTTESNNTTFIQGYLVSTT